MSIRRKQPKSGVSQHIIPLLRNCTGASNCTAAGNCAAARKPSRRGTPLHKQCFAVSVLEVRHALDGMLRLHLCSAASHSASSPGFAASSTPALQLTMAEASAQYCAYVARGNGAEMFKSCLVARGCWKLLTAYAGDDTTAWDLWYGNNGQTCPFKRIRPGAPCSPYSTSELWFASVRMHCLL